ncbi:MAG TPA: flagellar biosynthetic protein FliO [Bryobacteraceae bacterium]|jgi:flagellar biosynthetic protein FliO|nr:flagellar biosynthetic protein FliO [Bryobacteraceae bacterium]
MFQQLLAIFLVLALLVTTLWLLRRKGLASLNLSLPRRSAGPKEMELIERLTLTAHHSLHLVRVKDRVLLIGLSPSGCNTLTEVQTQ